MGREEPRSKAAALAATPWERRSEGGSGILLLSLLSLRERRHCLWEMVQRIQDGLVQLLALQALRRNCPLALAR